jgi:hypothetical protein
MSYPARGRDRFTPPKVSGLAHFSGHVSLKGPAMGRPAYSKEQLEPDGTIVNSAILAQPLLEQKTRNTRGAFR